MNKYLVIIYLSIMAAFLVIIQIGIRHPMNPADMAGTQGTRNDEKFELMAVKQRREQEKMQKAVLAVKQAQPNAEYDTMVYIPPGSFMLGNAHGQNSEKPVRQIVLSGYWIDKYEAPMAQYYAFIAATGHREPRLAGYLALASVDLSTLMAPNKPAVGVSWEDARAYCEWKGKRLPTEAEWEKAAKGQGQRQWPWGDAPNAMLANLDGGEDQFQGTAPVDGFPAGQSPYGLFNMTGNAMEWVNDWYDEQYYKFMPPSNPPGPSIGDEKVVRGGSWHDSLRYAHTYSRFKMFPEYRDATIGFRCARSKSEAPTTKLEATPIWAGLKSKTDNVSTRNAVMKKSSSLR
ncbi:MAG TPA: formylglycine-generating enzyme family protein [Nitrospiria bacterium]|nr:formylglycine-generating enzyme family protein [Nitrospiria bacterium]